MEKKRAGRESLILDSKLIKAIGSRISTGSPDNNAYELSGVSSSGFYKWLRSGKFWLENPDTNPDDVPDTIIKTEPGISLCVELVQVVTRARATARRKAIKALMFGVDGGKTTSKVIKKFTETRLKKDGTEYLYERVETIDTTDILAPDWKAGIAFLERRDREMWTPKNEVTLINFEDEVIQRIKSGRIGFDELVEEFKDEARVLAWFQRAGVDPHEFEATE